MREAAWPREKFFAWLDKAMRRRGFAHTQALAEAAGVSHSTLSNWRGGKQRPTLDSLAAVADALDEDPVFLFRLAGLIPGEPAEPRTDPWASDVLQRLDQMQEQLAEMNRIVAERVGRDDQQQAG